MIVLAIDPGNRRSGAVTWSGELVPAFGIWENAKLEQSLLFSTCDAVVIERIRSYGMSVGDSVFETCFWTGRFWKTADLHGKPVYFLNRISVKTHLCRSSRAKDSNIRQALIDRFGPPGTKKRPGFTYGFKKDIWSAFALAVTWFDNPELAQCVSGSRPETSN